MEAEAKVRMHSITRVMDVEEDNQALKTGGDMEMEIKIQEIGSKIQVLM